MYISVPMAFCFIAPLPLFILQLLIIINARAIKGRKCEFTEKSPFDEIFPDASTLKSDDLYSVPNKSKSIGQSIFILESPIPIKISLS
jgi:hypothetical protein